MYVIDSACLYLEVLTVRQIMVDRYGHFFHIDFGHFLGNFKYFGLLNRDKAPFAFPPGTSSLLLMYLLIELISVARVCSSDG
jgi:hypothetical protein